MEADRRHTTTGLKSLESCTKSVLDLAELVVDRDSERLKSPGRDVDVSRPGATRYGGLDGLRQIAGGAQRAARHYELSDPAGPTFLAVLLQDALDLGHVVVIDDLRRGELCVGVHPHVERAIGAEAESATRVVDLRAGKTEVEEDQVRWAETVFCSQLAKLGKSSVNDHR